MIGKEVYQKGSIPTSFNPLHTAAQSAKLYLYLRMSLGSFLSEALEGAGVTYFDFNFLFASYSF